MIPQKIYRNSLPNMIFWGKKKIMLCKSYIENIHSMMKLFCATKIMLWKIMLEEGLLYIFKETNSALLYKQV